MKSRISAMAAIAARIAPTNSQHHKGHQGHEAPRLIAQVALRPLCSLCSLCPLWWSEPPTQEHGTDGEPGADRREQHEMSLFQLARAHGVVERERNRRGGRVAEALDV